MPERATAQSRSEKSAEAVVAASRTKGRTRRSVQRRDDEKCTASDARVGGAGRVAARRGDASSHAASGEARSPRHAPQGAGRDLLAQALARQNMQRAWKHVKANKGAAGVNGLGIAQTRQHLKHAWSAIRQQRMEGAYRPQPVRRVSIPKPDGSERELGIPTV